MLSVKGTFENGVAQPAKPVDGRDGQAVIITFLDGDTGKSPMTDVAAWEAMEKLVEDCAIETGISDLAHQHDHYLYGKPKCE